MNAQIIDKVNVNVATGIYDILVLRDVIAVHKEIVVETSLCLSVVTQPLLIEKEDFELLLVLKLSFNLSITVCCNSSSTVGKSKRIFLGTILVTLVL